jgi:hypothetical protein
LIERVGAVLAEGRLSGAFLLASGWEAFRLFIVGLGRGCRRYLAYKTGEGIRLQTPVPSSFCLPQHDAERSPTPSPEEESNEMDAFCFGFRFSPG